MDSTNQTRLPAVARAHIVTFFRLAFHGKAGLETNARPLARGELNSVRASGSSDLTSPVGEWIFFFYFFF